jgi:hypothetical protein
MDDDSNRCAVAMKQRMYSLNPINAEPDAA